MLKTGALGRSLLSAIVLFAKVLCMSLFFYSKLDISRRLSINFLDTFRRYVNLVPTEYQLC